MTAEDLTTEVTAALGAWEPCPEYYVRSCATDGPVPKCASDCLGGCKGSGQRPVFSALWTECHNRTHTDLPSNTRWPGHNGDCKGLVLNVTVETLLEGLLPTDSSMTIVRTTYFSVVYGNAVYYGDTLLEALSKALVATREG